MKSSPAKISIDALEMDDVEAVTELWRVSMQRAIGIPPIHSFESQAFFLREILAKNDLIYVAREEKTHSPVAFLATDGREVSQLYVHPNWQSYGIGSQLLNLAKDISQGSLRLRTFEVNEKARRFYERHGFVAIGGDCDNEEGLPDLLYAWKVS
ncbi:GNAT family acetyltransferase [Photobacterium galatheae]|uniref:GNAT family acetyltransferase n=1 Tax=Photobacterium galatheae TaxID=1654360 RepID=A0A066RW87_9GAMM|nr:GNAT family acetyltransferase [Photobacterium galatheae]